MGSEKQVQIQMHGQDRSNQGEKAIVGCLVWLQLTTKLLLEKDETISTQAIQKVHLNIANSNVTNQKPYKRKNKNTAMSMYSLT